MAPYWTQRTEADTLPCGTAPYGEMLVQRMQPSIIIWLQRVNLFFACLRTYIFFATGAHGMPRTGVCSRVGVRRGTSSGVRRTGACRTSKFIFYFLFALCLYIEIDFRV